MKRVVATVSVLAACWLLAACDVRVQDLGGSRSSVSDVNSYSTVVGSSWLPESTPEHPVSNGFLRSFDGEVTHLLPLAGQDYSWPYAINDDGVAVGESAVYSADASTIVAGTQRAVRWDEAGNASDLGTLPGGTTAGAWDINAHGVTVGWSRTASGVRPFVLDPAVGTMTELPLPAGASSATATAINDAGIAVGNADYPPTFPPTGQHGSRAVMWDLAAGTVTALASNVRTRAHDINEAGVIVGGKVVPNGVGSVMVPVMWMAAGALEHIGAPDGVEIPDNATVSIVAQKANDAGQVIVTGYLNYSWSPTAGVVLPAEGRSFVAVNDSGVIGGTKDGRAVLMFPDN